ncbi:hypothetical protein BDV33DRAFT_202457 [Aspergillus novoparasiticus]|uniref:Uncharacterized protein n=1 Tax=Aspergillus novoparasiticus TaxID=986946 RepID=A0A5N6EVR8_9EURO|nr:hypothetical protein BDV33DRAFT_202457 [Aspergillus novoparasiticus]
MTLRGPESGLDWSNGHVTTSDYMWGPKADYYSYLLTQSLAADMWFSMFRPDPMSREAGERYQ